MDFIRTTDGWINAAYIVEAKELRNGGTRYTMHDGSTAESRTAFVPPGPAIANVSEIKTALIDMGGDLDEPWIETPIVGWQVVRGEAVPIFPEDMGYPGEIGDYAIVLPDGSLEIPHVGRFASREKAAEALHGS